MADNTIYTISLDKIKVQKHNVRKHDIDQGIEDLAANIRANGLIQPIVAYLDTEKDTYVILTGQRRYNAHDYLNENHPNEGWDKIRCILIDEPESNNKKMSLSLAENITQLPMTNSDLVKAVTDLYNVYGDEDMVQKEFGISKYMINKYVRLARLPEELKKAIEEGIIHHNPRTAENAALKAVDALQYTKGCDIPIENVISFSKVFAKDETDNQALVTEAPKGGTIDDIVKRARKKPKMNLQVPLSTEIAEKLQKIAEKNNETQIARATHYVNEGTTRDYSELDD